MKTYAYGLTADTKEERDLDFRATESKYLNRPDRAQQPKKDGRPQVQRRKR